MVCFESHRLNLTDIWSARPTNAVTGERITPSGMDDHRLTHRFLGPCCLCPLEHTGQYAFTEAAMVMETSGRYVGQYVASCACDSCGYYGKTVTHILTEFTHRQWSQYRAHLHQNGRAPCKLPSSRYAGPLIFHRDRVDNCL